MCISSVIPKMDDAFIMNMMTTTFNNCTVSSKTDITLPEFERNSLIESSTETKYTERGQKKYNTGVILIKIAFFCTTIFHALIEDAMQCNSGKGEMWEILMVRNMKSLPEKSKSSDLVHFAANGR